MGWVMLCGASAPPVTSHNKHPASSGSLMSECQGEKVLPSPNCGRTPTPAFAKEGRLWLAFSQNGHIYLTHSDDFGKSFSPSIAVNRTPEEIYDGGENRPKVALGPKGELYISWTQKTPGRFSGNIRFARTLNEGDTFDKPLIVNTDKTLIGHRFDAMAVDSKGRIHITWLDKRDRAIALKNGKKYAGSALYYAVSEDRGQHFNFNRKVSDHTCECCRIAVAVDPSDRLAVLWRHIYPVNIRDHAFKWLSPEATSPTSEWPLRATDDGWKFDGCPHKGPSLSITEKGLLHMVWFSWGEKNKGIFYGLFDPEKGTLQKQHLIDNAFGAMHPHILGQGKLLHVVWKSIQNDKTELLLQTSLNGGDSWSTPLAIAETTQDSDHPILVQWEDSFFTSWHTDREGYRLLPIPSPVQRRP